MIGEADKVAAAQAGKTDHMAAFSLEGILLGEIKGHPLGPQVILADLDGDGKRDLFLSQEGDYGPDPAKGVRGFGVGGKEILVEGPELNSPYLIAGDIDGDHKAEIIGWAESGGVQAIGIGQKMTPVNFPATAKLPFNGTWAHDFDGDGVDEILSSKGVVHNLVTKQELTLQLPTNYTKFHIDGMFSGNAVAFTDGSSRRIAALLGDTGGGTVAETPAVWDTNGKLICSEDLGEKAAELRVLRTSQRDHLAVLTHRRLLIWP